MCKIKYLCPIVRKEKFTLTNCFYVEFEMQGTFVFFTQSSYQLTIKWLHFIFYPKMEGTFLFPCPSCSRNFYSTLLNRAFLNDAGFECSGTSFRVFLYCKSFHILRMTNQVFLVSKSSLPFSHSCFPNPPPLRIQPIE